MHLWCKTLISMKAVNFRRDLKLFINLMFILFKTEILRQNKAYIGHIAFEDIFNRQVWATQNQRDMYSNQKKEV